MNPLLADVPDAPAPTAVDRPGHTVPSARGRAALLFLGTTLVEYWVAPLFLGLTNYAGLWSLVGNLLFAATMAAVTVFVVVPLLPYLRWAWSERGTPLLFGGLFAAGMTLGLFGTNMLQWSGATGTPFGVDVIPVYTPFGAFPSWVLQGPIEGVLNVEVVGTLTLLSFLGAATLALRRADARRSCAIGPRVERPWGARLAWAAIWSPFGFVSGCSVCSPAYLAALALVAPGVAAQGYSGLPLVPWIGFAGLLFLLSLALVTYLLGRSTSARTEAKIAEGST